MDTLTAAIKTQLNQTREERKANWARCLKNVCLSNMSVEEVFGEDIEAIYANPCLTDMTRWDSVIAYNKDGEISPGATTLKRIVFHEEEEEGRSRTCTQEEIKCNFFLDKEQEAVFSFTEEASGHTYVTGAKEDGLMDFMRVGNHWACSTYLYRDSQGHFLGFSGSRETQYYSLDVGENVDLKRMVETNRNSKTSETIADLLFSYWFQIFPYRNFVICSSTTSAASAKLVDIEKAGRIVACSVAERKRKQREWKEEWLDAKLGSLVKKIKAVDADVREKEYISPKEREVLEEWITSLQSIAVTKK